MPTLVRPTPPRPRRSLRRRAWLRFLCHPAEHAVSALLLLLALCGLLFFHGLAGGDLYRTESLRALIGGEFLRSGNWLVPALHGEPLLTKPPGMYAAIALASWPVGSVHEWTARLPSAVAATVTVLLFYWYFTRQLGRRAGLVAAVVLPLSLLWLEKVPAAEIDMLEVAWVSASLLFFLWALDHAPALPQQGRGEKSIGWLAAMLCVAGGFLTKWTAPAFFYAAVIPLLWWRGQLRLLLSWPHLLSAAVAVGLGLAWVAAVVATVGWDTFLHTVGREALMRLSPAHHERPYPWGEVLLHPLKLWAACLPASAVLPLTFWKGFANLWDERGRRLLQALHCWTWPSLLFWSLIPDHAVRHAFPLFPGIAGLSALVWIAWLDGHLRWPFRRVSAGQALVGLVIMWLGCKLLFVHVVMPSHDRQREPRSRGERLAAVVPRGQTLYLFRPTLEGMEGIVFYYTQARAAEGTDAPAVRRLAALAQLPSSDEPVFCIVDASAWDQWHSSQPGDVLLRLRDEREGAFDDLLLVRFAHAP